VKAVIVGAAAAAIFAAAVGGYVVGHRGPRLAEIRPIEIITPAAAQDGGAVIYYQDPDGGPSYSLTPRKTPDGRDYRAVRANADAEQQVKANTAPASADRRIKFYRNPMGLPDTSAVPKKDSMGMDYVPVYADEDSDDGTIQLSPGKIQRTGVVSEAAALRAIRAQIRASGTIQLDERRISVIAMRSESWVQKVADVTTGSRVVKGQPLMEIYSPQVSTAAAEYVATITSKSTGAIGAYGRGSRQRLVNLDVPEAAISAIERTASVPIGIDWSAPRDGIVLERNATEGMRAQPGDILFRVADVSVVWALLDIAERDLGKVAIGQAVVIHPRGLVGRNFTGTIERVYPQLNRDTRTVRVRVELANPDGALLPDMYVDAEITGGGSQQVLTVPESAVLDSGTRQVVIVALGEGRFVPREVSIGSRGGGYVEIRDGVGAGDRVVVSANFLIDAESNLRAALKGLADTGARP
jgi:Cu(I)/Ag(I) efflux system membrane fusion protein